VGSPAYSTSSQALAVIRFAPDWRPQDRADAARIRETFDLGDA
jgi:hypothetical protein